MNGAGGRRTEDRKQKTEDRTRIPPPASASSPASRQRLPFNALRLHSSVFWTPSSVLDAHAPSSMLHASPRSTLSAPGGSGEGWGEVWAMLHAPCSTPHASPRSTLAAPCGSGRAGVEVWAMPPAHPSLPRGRAGEPPVRRYAKILTCTTPAQGVLVSVFQCAGGL